MISIIPYEEKYQPDFKRLNLEYLDQYGLTEQFDLDILNDPFKTIIEPGGFILLLADDKRAYGSIGLAKPEEGVYEVVKMVIDPDLRGKGYGKLMLGSCIEKAREMGIQKIVLFSNSQLTAAINMYEQFGFRHVPVTDSHFVTADVKMELSLSTN